MIPVWTYLLGFAYVSTLICQHLLWRVPTQRELGAAARPTHGGRNGGALRIQFKALLLREWTNVRVYFMRVELERVTGGEKWLIPARTNR